VNVKVHDLMTASVITVDRSTSVDDARRVLEDHGIGAVPVINPIGEPVGIVSSTDLLRDLDPGTPVELVMTGSVYTVPQYDDVSTAARVMRNHKIHRVVVTHEKKVVGMLTAFDLLKLVEEHRYVAKNPPTVSSRKGSKRR
jgi:CBS domain-containing protein